MKNSVKKIKVEILINSMTVFTSLNSLFSFNLMYRIPIMFSFNLMYSIPIYIYIYNIYIYIENWPG